MKIDNKGWGLNTLLICTGVIFIALITVTFFSIRLNGLLGKENKATNKTEKVVENQVEINYYIKKKNKITSEVEKSNKNRHKWTYQKWIFKWNKRL